MNSPINEEEMTLKPCPFCGCNPEVSREYVSCSTVRCIANYKLVSSEEWNTRTPAIDKQKLIKWMKVRQSSLVERALIEIESGDFDL